MQTSKISLFTALFLLIVAPQRSFAQTNTPSKTPNLPSSVPIIPPIEPPQQLPSYRLPANDSYESEFSLFSCTIISTSRLPSLSSGKSISELRAQVVQSPKDERVRFYLGSQLLTDGKWEEAISEFRLAIDLAKHNQEFLRVGFSYLKLGRSFPDGKLPQEAATAYKESINAFKKGIALLKQGKTQQFFYSEYYSYTPLASAYEGLGSALEAAGKNDEAISAYESAIDAFSALPEPLMPGFLSLNDLLLDKLDRPQYLLALYQRLLKRSPSSTWLTEKIITLQKNLEEEAVYTKAIQAEPRNLNLYLKWADALRSQKRSVKLEKVYRQIVEQYQPVAISNEQSVIIEAPVWGRKLRNRCQPELALLIYQKDLAVNPNNAATYEDMGKILQRLGRIKEASTAYRKAIEIDPKRYGAYRTIVETLDAQVISPANPSR
ncbi:tetratricopeptide repeat protein [Cylindrospermum stagnale PCC 7417]|uniref:Tetratricopeptide repeat protein n=1 Tax=Cylindrospermum stagnale PCC 7417 TaxID=56107 RepID=K9WVI1_9NOST|nr:tetratricopeptide repeat protein [Cylindrospermum stagnale]AFZ23517.1 tetratricopeptide repeat protein [Cylindrospermum stagnale PCC 7417]